MKIVTPDKIEQIAWEGPLEPAGTVMRSAESARVTIGEPVWWAAADALAHETGKAWTPPAGERKYTLIRLACTLHRPQDSRTRYTEATLHAGLRLYSGAGAIVAHDVYPLRVSAESKRTYAVGLGADLKFSEAVSVELAKAGAEIEYLHVFPVIQGFGVGESRPCWTFARHAAHPLVGSQCVYGVAACPADVEQFALRIELFAELETRFGPVRLGLPAETKNCVVRTIRI